MSPFLLLLLLVAAVSGKNGRNVAGVRERTESDFDAVTGLEALGSLFGGFGGLGDVGDGGRKPKPCKNPAPASALDQNDQLVANGCGPQGIRIDASWGLLKCCNGHDLCFGVCGTSFKFCESRFKKCMEDVCRESTDPRACNQEANSFSGMTGLFGGGMHASAQSKACKCYETEAEAASAHHKYLKEFYSRRNLEECKTDAQVDAILSKNKGKEGTMYFNLVLKYGTGKYGSEERPGTAFVKFDGVSGEL